MDSGDHIAEGTNLVEHTYSAKYSYQSLRAQEIRVLKLLPASSRDAILQGELVHVTLHRKIMVLNTVFYLHKNEDIKTIL